MTLLFADGFDHLSASTFARKWGGGTTPTFTTARNGNGIQNPSSSTFVPLSNEVTVIHGFAFNTTVMSNGNGIAHFQDNGTTHVSLNVNPNGSLSVKNGDGTILGTSAVNLVHISTNHYLEWKVLHHASAGTIDVQLDGVNVLSGTGLDTINTANVYSDRVALGYFGSGFQIYDDMYICDVNGAVNADFLGDVKIETLFPNAAGTTTQFTPSAGANYECVDDATPDDDTTYVESSTVGQIDLYNFGALSTTNGTILAVQANLVAKKTDANVRQIRENCRAGTTTYNAGTTFTLASGYLDHMFIRETSPNGGAAWTIAEINASQWGIEVVT